MGRSPIARLGILTVCLLLVCACLLGCGRLIDGLATRQQEPAPPAEELVDTPPSQGWPGQQGQATPPAGEGDAEPSGSQSGEAVIPYQTGVVEGRGWIGPLTYHVRGVELGPLSVEQENLHRYDTGRFYGPSVMEVWGTVENMAYDLRDSQEYSYGVMTFWLLIRYEDTAGDLKILYDSRETDSHGQKLETRYGPGELEYSVTVTIPNDVKQVPGRSTVIIEISNTPTWTSGGNRMAAQMSLAPQ